jgi:hypothetical protein
MLLEDKNASEAILEEEDEKDLPSSAKSYNGQIGYQG